MHWLVIFALITGAFALARWYYKPTAPPEVDAPTLTDGQLALALHPPVWVNRLENGLTPRQRRTVEEGLLSTSNGLGPETDALNLALVRKQISVSAYMSARVAVEMKRTTPRTDTELLATMFAPLIGVLNTDNVQPELFLRMIVLYAGTMMSGARVSLPIAFPVADDTKAIALPLCCVCSEPIKTQYKECPAGHTACAKCATDVCKLCKCAAKWTLSPLIVARN